MSEDSKTSTCNELCAYCGKPLGSVRFVLYREELYHTGCLPNQPNRTIKQLETELAQQDALLAEVINQLNNMDVFLSVSAENPVEVRTVELIRELRAKLEEGA